MTKIIYYFLYDELENKNYYIQNDSIILHIVKGNKTYLTSPSCGRGRRAHRIYLDGQLNTKEYQNWIDTCIKPMLYLNEGDIIFI
jgi:hypothetical protein